MSKLQKNKNEIVEKIFFFKKKKPNILKNNLNKRKLRVETKGRLWNVKGREYFGDKNSVLREKFERVHCLKNFLENVEREKFRKRLGRH